MVLGLFALAESDVVKGSNAREADVWGILVFVFVGVVLLIVWIARRFRRNASARNHGRSNRSDSN